jgi:3'-phosphoadenosine 5'-phosphosulfate sulfotransferase (PAPS reductase)/FAD synthetase
MNKDKIIKLYIDDWEDRAKIVSKMKLERWQLTQRQNLPLDVKVGLTKTKIRQFYQGNSGNVYVAFSGGKDSTALLHLVRSVYPDVPAVFVDTGLEYPEIKDFVKSIPNVITIRPKMDFYSVIKKYGYPVISKKVSRQIRDIKNPTDRNKATRNLYLTGMKQDGTKTKVFKLSNKWKKLIDAPFNVSEQCCDIMKKEPMHRYEKETGRKCFVGTMASDSMQRASSYLATGCNNFEKGMSIPMAFWLEKDVWEYIKLNELPYCKIYDTGIKRTGCIYCCFGVHLEKSPNRFERMKVSHNNLYNYCIDKLEIGKVLDFVNVPYGKEK